MSSVFVLNCGSSSIKFQVVQPKSAQVHFKGIAENVQTSRCVLHWEVKNKKQKKMLRQSGYDEVIEEIIKLLKKYPSIEKTVVVIGHRVVHGGEIFDQSIIVDDTILSQIHDCSHLAPLHNPANALGIVMMQELLPKLPQVAVFDTAFHQTLPKYAYIYPIPYVYYEEYNVRRYGFHGTSHHYITKLSAEILGKKVQELSLISAHLGHGCSLCAILKGKSIDTSMGFTPLEGLMMGQRSGDVDPALIGFLAERMQIQIEEVMNILNNESGLLGVSGVSEDLRLVKQAAKEGEDLATLAIEMFCYRLAKYIASYLVPLGLPDALVFTGGIGENDAFIRERVVEWLEPMGFSIDPSRNKNHGIKSKNRISPKKQTPDILVLQTNEELMIARDALALIK